MEKVDSTTIYSEPWVELYKDCFRNSQNMKKKIATLYKRKTEIAEAVKYLSVDDMLASIKSSDFLEKREGAKIAASFYYSIGPNLFRKTFGAVVSKITNDNHYERYAELLICTFTFVKGSVHDCPEDEQEREIELFVALVSSKIFEIAVFAEDKNLQKKFMNLVEAVCDKSREVSKTNGNALRNNIVNNAQLLMHKSSLEFLYLDYSLRHKLDRLNTAIMMTYMFPINPKLKIEHFDGDSCFMFQVSTLKKHILDPFVPIRAFLAKEFLGILGRGWFQLDNNDLREILSLFVDKLANDSVAVVRSKVYEGLGLLSAYPFTGSCIVKLMKIKIPFILRDIDKSVRLAGLNCLDTLVTSKVLTLDTTHIKDFVVALEVEKDMALARKIVRLLVFPLFDDFINPEVVTSNYLNIFKEHFTQNRFANYLFHKWIQLDNLLNINAISKHVRNLLISSISLLRENLSQQSSLSELTPYEASQLKSQHSVNLDVVRCFVEAAATLYSKLRKQLMSLEKKKAVKVIDDIVLKLHSIVKKDYKDTQIYQVTMTLLEYLGNDIVIDEITRMLRSIENFTVPDDVIMEYFDRCVDHRPQHILDFILTGIEIIECDNKIKSSNGLKYFEKVIDYCSRLLYSTKTKNLIVKKWTFYVEKWSNNLENILKILEERCQIPEGEEFFFSDDLILKTLKIKFICSILLDSHKNNSIRALPGETSEGLVYSAWEFWMKFHCVIEKYYKNTTFVLENDGRFKERLFLFGLETFKELCSCYELNTSCVQEANSWLNTLNNVNSPETILISLLKVYPDIIDAMYHGPDLYNSIRNILHRYLINIKPWILECFSKECETSQKLCNEINRLWKVINNKFQSLVLINVAPLELDF